MYIIIVIVVLLLIRVLIRVAFAKLNSRNIDNKK